MYSKNGQLIGIGVLVIILLVAAILTSSVMSAANWNKNTQYPKFDFDAAGAVFLGCKSYSNLTNGGTYALFSLKNNTEVWYVPAIFVKNNPCPNDFYYGDPQYSIEKVNQ